MEILIAITHILGSVIVLVVFGFLVGAASVLVDERYGKRVFEEISVSLGVKVEDLFNEETVPKILQLSSERYSSELLRNRLSDFFGLIKTLWGWLSNLIQVLVLGAVIWFTFTDNIDNAVYAWFIVGISISFWVVGVVFSLICKLLTGRYPGEAKQARKAAVDWVKN